MVGTSRRTVPDELRVLAGRQPHGIMTLAAADGAGIAAEEMARWVRSGVLVRVFRGTYVLAEVWDAASSEARHVLRGAAHVVALEGRSVVSHTTAAAFHGLPLLAPPPESVHLARRHEGQGRSGRGFVVHETYGEGAEHVEPRDDGSRSAAGMVWAVLPVLAALGVAELHGWVAGVTALDAALHRRLTTVDEARGWLERLPRRPRLRLLRRVVDAADPLCESPLESQVRLLLLGLGYRVVAQHVLRTRAGEFVARVDFWLPDLGVVVEADGAVKYVRVDGSADHAAVRSERRRHQAIEALGHPVVRVEQHDLSIPEAVRQRIRSAATRAGR
ncbi:type IV toxin-antitoxin system AbiEi family antitoxin domain-containing protein [Ornithinimicrobium cerasi]|uniref:Very-short-patch-repair endonuclease n=1 Tax=Ornithinimicrobium cerasi TaxID=2248773 RepID=A0A285VEB2_9MICO|nr:type IV toxin-antitoxin system AbiEi family antitoxin domain-containing protein [Ornithinimicrobium cerasi]SOC52442.1 Very-short-patch-repair endonuclease [Ornithinimicrobium cerasi]